MTILPAWIYLILLPISHTSLQSCVTMHVKVHVDRASSRSYAHTRQTWHVHSYVLCATNAGVLAICALTQDSS